jgi:hypothetical protein
MAATNKAPTPEELRLAIAQEREQLAGAVEALREDFSEATDVAGKMRANLPLVAGGALGLGFIAAGGVGAAMRLLMRRGREGKEKARVGRFSLMNRD